MFCGLITLLGIFVIYKLLDHLLRLPRVGNYSDRYIFVTGCDSGFGHALAKRLDSLGCHVFAGCFTEKGETELRKICSERLRPVPLDVTNSDSVRNALKLVSDNLQSAGKGLWGVVNNAGVMLSLGQLEWMTVDNYRQHCEVNLFGLIDVTMKFLPLVKTTRGRIVNMSSFAGRESMSTFATYTVSKFGVEAFTDALRRSLRPFGCKAVIIEPGGFKTSLTNIDNVLAVYERSWNQCSPEMKEEYASTYANLKKRLFDADRNSFKCLPSDLSPVVDAYEHGLLAKYPRPRYMVGSGAFLVALVAALPEYISDWLVTLWSSRPSAVPVPVPLKPRL